MIHIRFSLLSLTTAICLMAAPALARQKPPQLPRNAPVPEQAEQQQTPLPQNRPDDAPEAISPPDRAPTPEAKPAPPDQSQKTPDEKPSLSPDPRSAATAAKEMPADELACRARLRTMGVVFREKPAERDSEAGCALPYPIVVTRLATNVELSPEAELNCDLAETVARFTANIVRPAARDILGADLAGINQASAYVCRPRHNGSKLSEHAFGNALDIAAFTMKDGSRIEVQPSPGAKQRQFLDHVRQAACGPFRTVLGPGSDPDHETHLHLDLAPRRNGSVFCQ
jgi:hypothetical protein